MEFRTQYGPWALVTGAGNGLGAEFARQLAQRGLNCFLVDVDSEGLTRTAKELESAYGIATGILTLDLRAADFMADLQRATDDLDIGLVINNAGISALGLFLQRPLQDHLQVVELNIRAPLMIAHHFAARMVVKKRGGLLFVASLSALQGTAYVANYAATKAWNLIFAEGLWEELRGTGVDVLGYLVGTTRTPGFEHSQPNLARAKMVAVMEMAPAVREALAALGKGPTATAGAGNRISAWFISRLLPRKWAVKLVSGATRALYE